MRSSFFGAPPPLIIIAQSLTQTKIDSPRISVIHKINKINQLTLFNEGDTQQFLISRWPSNSRSNLNLEILVFDEGGKPENQEKNPRSKGEDQQQTQSTYDAGSGNRTRDTLVGGKRSHHCTNPAPQRLEGVQDSLDSALI